MNKYQQLAYEFQSVPGSLYLPLPTEPTPLPPWAVDLWRRLITEEKDELIQVLESGDIAQVVHEQCDLLYVLYGCAVWMGIDLGAAKHFPLDGNLVETKERQRMRCFNSYTNHALEAIDKHPRNEIANPRIRLGWIVGMLIANPPNGIDLWPSYQAIHTANMAKMKGGTIYRQDGKIQKPLGWQPANIRAVLEAQGVLLDN